MRLEGIHHITAITADAPRNVDFYARLLGLRLVKKTVNQDDPTVYHLFYADEHGSPGSDLTFFEYPGARRGRAGAGDGAPDRLAGHERGGAPLLGGAAARRERAACARAGAAAVLRPGGARPRARRRRDRRRAADRRAPGDPGGTRAPGLRRRARLQLRAGSQPPLLEQALDFKPIGEASYELRGSERGSFYVYDQAREPGIGGSGTVHHVAWSSPMEEHEAWRRRVLEGGASPTPVIDRYYFRSIYFREPSGVLFEIATSGPGFTADEPLEHLGERLSLPPGFEHLREWLEPVLTPLPNPRAKEPVP